MSRKLNSMRVLERAGAPYDVLTFPDTIHSADGVADHLGLSRDEVYKTLVVERVAGGKPLLVMVASDRALDLRKLATDLREKKLRMARHADAERLTRLRVGGISPLALINRGFDVYLDKRALEQDWIVVSAGRRGIDIRLCVKDLIQVTGAALTDAT